MVWKAVWVCLVWPGVTPLTPTLQADVAGAERTHHQVAPRVLPAT